MIDSGNTHIEVAQLDCSFLGFSCRMVIAFIAEGSSTQPRYLPHPSSQIIGEGVRVIFGKKLVSVLLDSLLACVVRVEVGKCNESLTGW